MCKTFCSSCLYIIHLITFKEYNKCMKIVIISRTSCLFQDVYFLYADTLVLALYFVVAIIISIHLKMQSNKNECSKRGK